MKNYIHLILLLLLFPFSKIALTQQLKYGSNNGKFLEIFDDQIYYEEYGQGIPLLLLHGGLIGSIAHYNQVIPEYAKEFRVIAIDSPGHGRSELPDSLSYQLLSDYFSQIIDALELDSVYIIGWSDGGIAALLLAADRPDKVKRVITVGALLDHSGYTIEGKGFLKLTFEEVEKWTDFVEEYKLIGYEGNNFKKFVDDCINMWIENPYVPIEKVNKINCRTLVVLGDRDSFIPIEHAVDMYRKIKGSELFIFPDAGHMVFWDNPQLIANVGTEFFKKE